ncbi:MAG: hypothetical protein Q4C65_05120 [Eubacteriales bacterium]|nr:hypothetical protein [Eubacteriales bacterium]
MINFEEELKKFHPSLEIDEAEDVIINHNLTDFTDILVEMVREQEKEKEQNAPGARTERVKE